MEPATISSGLESLIKEVFTEATKVESVSVFSRSGIVIVAEAKKLPCRPELLGSMASVAFAAMEEAMVGGDYRLLTLTANFNEKVMVVQPLSPSMLQVAFVSSPENVEDAAMAMGRFRQRVGSEMPWLR